MSNARLRIDLEKIVHNTRRVLAISHQHGFQVMGVTKGAAGLPEVAKAMLAGGIETLGDSRLDNIARLRAAGIQTHTTLLRSPGPSDTSRTIELADASLNSDMEIVEALSIEARMQRKIHGVILMVDLQTGREGLPPDRLAAACRKLRSLPGIQFQGIGAYFHVASDSKHHLQGLQVLVSLAKQVEKELGKPPAILSGGSSNIFLPSRWRRIQIRGSTICASGRPFCWGFPPPSIRSPLTVLSAIRLSFRRKRSKSKRGKPVR
jgi:predicted amino acid racemase